jgi:FixJ family two-component response regulator
VQSFASAEEFLQLEPRPVRGCLVADVHLGRMSGLELHATLRTHAARMPVILTSGVDDASMEDDAVRLGAIAFLRKPFEPNALLDSIRLGLTGA